MINVFIDSNIWLSLYDFSNDDLEQFSKLKDLISNDVTLFVPEQVRDEVYRNRENKIKSVLDSFKDFKMQVPNICKGYARCSELELKIEELHSLHKEFVKEVRNDAAKGMLKADNVLGEIFKEISFIKCNNENFEEAVKRFNEGKPPGKDKKYGDAINWIVLLNSAPNNQDMFFVSADKDYRSVLDEENFNPYLLREWKDRKNSDLYFYRSLSEFINQHIKTIDLVTERDKSKQIARLANSVSFQNTHDIMACLNKHSAWTSTQIKLLCTIAKENSQVGWIITDPDVCDFYQNILNRYDDSVPDENVQWVKQQLEEVAED